MIDWQRVRDLKQAIGQEVFNEVIAVFLKESAEVVARLPAANTATALRDDLHILKGSALNLGFTDLAQLCATGEEHAAAGHIDVALAPVQDAFELSRVEFLSKLAINVD